METKQAIIVSAVVTAALTAIFFATRKPSEKKKPGEQKTIEPSVKCGPVSVMVLERAKSVIPATFVADSDGNAIGNDKWMTFGASWKTSTPGTSCALLVGWALSPWVNTHYGLSSMRDEAKKLGLWVEATPDNAPCPGSAYLETDLHTGDIMHVGLIESYYNDSVTTLDSGGGVKPEQTAGRNVRKRSVVNGKVILTAFGKDRVLDGWLDTGLIKG